MNSLGGVPYQYQGQEKDPETNLLNFELRQFDPRLGRWYNPDPMGEFHSPYLAMGNNLVSVTDPTGGYTSDQFWNSTDAPHIGAYSNFNFGGSDLRDGAQINEMPVADPSKNSYLFMTPAERRNMLALNGTSYEQQFADKVLNLAFLGGYKDKDGNNWYYSPRKNDIGAWINMVGEKSSLKEIGHLADGKNSMFGTFNPVNAAVKWCGLGYNGAAQRHLWAQRTYGGSGDGSFLDNLHYSFATFNSKFNPIAHLVDAMNGAWRGTDRFGNDQSGIETATKAASGIVFVFGGAIAEAYAGAVVGEGQFIADAGVQFGNGQNQIYHAFRHTDKLGLS